MTTPEDESRSERLEQLLEEGAALADQERWEEAFALLLDGEAEHPDDATLLCMLGVAARATGADDAAYDYFRRCLAQDPDDPVLLTTAGSVLALWDDPEAERALRLAALTAPHLPATRLAYGSYLAREGQFELALQELEAARSLGGEPATVAAELGIAYLLAGRLEEGLAELGDAIGVEPNSARLQLLHALALLEAGQPSEAAEQLFELSLTREDDWELQAAAALAAASESWQDEAWNALARAELLPEADPGLIREIEELLAADREAAWSFLHGELAPAMLRTRLRERG